MHMDTAAPHLAERELLQLLDGDSSLDERVSREAHLEVCPVCTERLEELRHGSERVRLALQVVRLPPDFPTAEEVIRRARSSRGGRPHRPAAVSRQAWLRAAAVLLVLLLPVALITPVRAALVEWMRQGWSAVAGAPTRSTSDAVIDGGETGSGYTVSFTPSAGRLKMTVEAHQASGTLVLIPTEGEEATLTVEGGSGAIPRIDEAGVTILNETGSTASYRLEVPPRVGRVDVRVGSAALVVVERSAIGPQGWSISLQP
jgi:hypothetical protein